MNRLTLAVLATFVVILLGSGLAAYLLREHRGTTSVVTPAASPSAANATTPGHEPSILGEIFGPDATGLSPANLASWETTSARIALRFALAAFLAAILAFRPRRGVAASRRNPYVAQT